MQNRTLNFLLTKITVTIASRQIGQKEFSQCEIQTIQPKVCTKFSQRQFSQNSDRRSCANVLRAYQQRVGLNTKFREGYREITLIPIFSFECSFLLNWLNGLRLNCLCAVTKYKTQNK